MAANEADPLLGQAEALLLETYGLRLLAFLCGVDEQLMFNRLNGTASLAPPAESMLTTDLVPFAQHVAAQLITQPGLPLSLALEFLARPGSGGGTSVGTEMRLAARDGIPDDLPEPDADDPVKLALRQLLVAAFPFLLAPRDPHWRTPHLSLYQHPARKELQHAVQQDDALRRLFTADDPSLGRSGFIYTSLGRGGSIQDVMFGEQLLVSAWETVTMTQSTPGLTDFALQVDRNVDDLRNAVKGRTVRIPGRLVFTGFTTEDGRPIATPWGILRPLQPWEREFAPPGLEGDVAGTDSSGKTTTVSYAGEMVLETTVPYSLVIEKMPDAMEVIALQWPAMKGYADWQRKTEGLQLALLLATERAPGSLVTARVAWQWAGDLYGHGGNVSWADRRSVPSFMPYEVSSEECDAVEQWAAVVEQHWTPRIDIAVRRLLSAANSRTDMADRLVDAVIVWENLFGTSQGEARFRISSAMAWLLAGDLPEREALQTALRKIYDDRSKIVHGGKTDENALSDQANAALTHALDALRILFRDRPDVLALSDGAARSTCMILGG